MGSAMLGPGAAGAAVVVLTGFVVGEVSAVLGLETDRLVGLEDEVDPLDEGG
jgi:hypothetical protein